MPYISYSFSSSSFILILLILVFMDLFIKDGLGTNIFIAFSLLLSKGMN